IDHDPFQYAVVSQNQVPHARQVHDLGARLVGGGDQDAGRVRRIDDVHALAVLDLFAGHADLFQNFVRRRADRRLVHQIAAGPEAATQSKGLLDDQRAEAHRGEITGADQARRSGADDDDVALDELIELLVVFPRDLSGDIPLSERRRFGLGHNDSLGYGLEAMGYG